MKDAMSLLLRILFWIAMVGTVTSAIYCGMVVVAALRFGARKRRAEKKPEDFLPSVSMLKPLHGAEPGLEQNLTTFFEQEYPEFELLFCARYESDEGLQLARRVGSRYPEVRARYLTCGEPKYPNPKMYSLAVMSEAAENDCLVTSDADCRVRKDYLRRCVQDLKDPKRALSSCLYMGTADVKNLATELDAVGKSVEMGSGVLVADMVEGGTKFALGVTMILRKKAFYDAGGYDDLGQYQAEDYVLGKAVGGAGPGRNYVAVCDPAGGAGDIVQFVVQEPVEMDAEHASLASLRASWHRADICGSLWIDWFVVGCASGRAWVGIPVAAGKLRESVAAGRRDAACAW